MTNKRFKVALSFTGERRDYISQVAELLAAELGKDKVFYDAWYKAELARPNLTADYVYGTTPNSFLQENIWLALLDRKDSHHLAVYNYTLSINEPFIITTLPVVTEVCYLLQTRCYPSKATDFLAAQTAGLFQLFNLT